MRISDWSSDVCSSDLFVYFRRDPARPNCDFQCMEAVMNECDIPYLLRRVRAHRPQAAAANCPEARLIHRRFVENYQHLLVGIRRDQLRERGDRGSQPCAERACLCEGQDPEMAQSRRATSAAAAAGERGENEEIGRATGRARGDENGKNRGVAGALKKK